MISSACRHGIVGALAVMIALLQGCATRAPARDYQAFIEARPATLLVLPPVNESPEVNATPGVWSTSTLPLAEAGYYVLPVTLVNETLRGNGVMTAIDAQAIPFDKLREVFGADAAVYLKVTNYGTAYAVLASETRVTVTGRVVDLRTGALLWEGTASASSSEEQRQVGGGLVGALVAAVVNQIVATSTDASYKYAGVASGRLLGGHGRNGILPGPRSPNAGKPPAVE